MKIIILVLPTILYIIWTSFRIWLIRKEQAEHPERYFNKEYRYRDLDYLDCNDASDIESPMESDPFSYVLSALLLGSFFSMPYIGTSFEEFFKMFTAFSAMFTFFGLGVFGFLVDDCVWSILNRKKS